MFLHRLERKATEINNRLQETNNNWEAVFFEMLFKNFGLHTNGTAFLQLAQAIPFSVIRKESHFSENLEALLFGKLNWLANSYEDSYFINLQNNWKYLKVKYNLSEEIGLQPQFFKLRPDNFPTIRISQFVNLWCAKPNLFSQIMEAATYDEISNILKSETSEYWINHYNFAKTSKAKRKNVSTSFLDLLIINTIIPIKFCYQLQQGKLNTDEIITMLEAIAPEKNNIVTKFSEFNVKVTNAFQSQSLLELKNEFCNKNKCLNCAIGLQLLKN